MNADTRENKGQDDPNFQNADRDRKANQKTSSPASHPITGNAEPDYADDLNLEQTGNRYDSENLDQESDSQSKDITEQDIEEDLIQNDPSEGFETDPDTQKSHEAESGPFEILEPEEDNPVKREFEIGELGNQELQQDERARDESGHGAPGHDKPSQRKF